MSEPGTLQVRRLIQTRIYPLRSMFDSIREHLVRMTRRPAERAGCHSESQMVHLKVFVVNMARHGLNFTKQAVTQLRLKRRRQYSEVGTTNKSFRRIVGPIREFRP